MCDALADEAIEASLALIERSADPCGESALVAQMVRDFRRNRAACARICVDGTSHRNLTERDGDMLTVTWNPGLRTELEQGCGGDPRAPVRRDPVASLLHEIVHVVQGCTGHDFNESEAVRIENIYRRSQGLCQRTRYGDAPLPANMQVACAPDRCGCERSGSMTLVSRDAPDATTQTAGDVAAAGARSPLPSR
jgi:hypothetical protein